MSKKDYFWLNAKSRKFLERGYLSEGETPEQRFRSIGERAEELLGIEGYADKFESYMKKGWYGLASPIISNFGKEKSLPISCNNSVCDDSISSILAKVSEIGMMTKNGAGTSIYLGNLRGRGSQVSAGGSTSGPVHFAELFDQITQVISQSNVRRGSCAAYLDIEHPDIKEFLKIRGEGHPIQDLSIGVSIGNEWVHRLLDGDKECANIWGALIKKRFEGGYPYILWRDNANDQKPQVYKDKGLTIVSSNLCSEIMLPSTAFESFVCDLSSMNLLYEDEWRNTDAVEVLFYLLYAALIEYKQKVKDIPYMEAAYEFAKNHMAIGLGVLGYHSLLQSKMIPFESMEAKMLNSRIFQNLQVKCLKASRELAEMFGEPEVLKGYGLATTTTMAIAPTKSNAFILGQVSQGIEPIDSNYCLLDRAKGKWPYKNPYLSKLLKSKGMNTQEIWDSILDKEGSVQHLKFLNEEEKAVFKTFAEISQMEIVIQAAQRQKYIDQGQSLNIMIPPDIPPAQVSQLLLTGWKMGLKSFYYQLSANPAQQLSRNILGCASCEG